VSTATAPRIRPSRTSTAPTGPWSSGPSLAYPRQPTRSPPRHPTEQRLAAATDRGTEPPQAHRPRIDHEPRNMDAGIALPGPCQPPPLDDAPHPGHNELSGRNDPVVAPKGADQNTPLDGHW
jgi:hypothetical protein